MPKEDDAGPCNANTAGTLRLADNNALEVCNGIVFTVRCGTRWLLAGMVAVRVLLALPCDSVLLPVLPLTLP